MGLFRLLLAVLLVVFPATLLGEALVGEAALIPVHTRQLSPWNAALGSEELLALDARALPLAADKTLMFQPQLMAAHARLAQGELPLWNPDNLCGVPLLAQAVHGLFHPPNFLAALLGPTRAWAWIALLQVALAGFCMYLLARDYALLPWPAALAGFLFAFCGYFTVRWNWYQIQSASIYLPAALLGVERIFSAGRRWNGVVWLAAAIGLSWLAGFPQGTLHLLYAAAALALVRGLLGLRGDTAARRRALGAGLATLLAVALGLSLGAPQLLPSLELAGSTESTRRAVPPGLAATLAMPPAGLLGAALPDIWGLPQDLAGASVPALAAQGVLSRLLLGPGANHVETSCALGLGALLLALAGCGAQRRGSGFALGLFLLGALLAIKTPILPAVLHLPGLSSGDPRRFVLLFCAGGALLAGFGLQRMLMGQVPRWVVNTAWTAAGLLSAALASALLMSDEAWARLIAPPLAAATALPEAEVAAHAPALVRDLVLLRQTLWPALVVAAAAALLLQRSRGGRPEHARTAGWLLSWLCIAELLRFAHANVELLPAAGHFAPPPGLERLLDDEGGRLVRFTTGDPQHALRYPLPPNTGLPFGVCDLSGYITLAPRRVEALHELLQAGTSFGIGTAALSDPAALDSPLLDLMAVSRVLSDAPLQRAGLTPLGPVGALHLYRNEGALPRAWLAAESQLVESEIEAAGFLREAPPDTALRRRVVLEATGAQASELAGAAQGGEPGSAALVRDDPESMELDVEALGGARVLVVADSWMPGWSATLDGRPAALVPANIAFRGLLVPEGRHRVTLSYGSGALLAGVVAAGLAVLVLVVGTLLSRRASPPRPSHSA